MELTSQQKDGLTELINIGYGRAAAALSELTGYRIILEVPQVTLHEMATLGPMLEDMLSPSVASVNQGFSGPVSGNALLVLDEASALVLSRLLGSADAIPRDFDTNSREIITEVGNILLNACLGVFGNLLQIQLTFSVPRLQLENIRRVFRSMAAESSVPQYGLMVHTRFNVRAGDVTGYMIIVLGIDSLDRLLDELEKWENRQTQ